MELNDLEKRIYLGKLFEKVENTFHTEEARKIGTERVEFMRRFLERIELELGGGM